MWLFAFLVLHWGQILLNTIYFMGILMLCVELVCLVFLAVYCCLETLPSKDWSRGLVINDFWKVSIYIFFWKEQTKSQSQVRVKFKRSPCTEYSCNTTEHGVAFWGLWKVKTESSCMVWCAWISSSLCGQNNTCP